MKRILAALMISILLGYCILGCSTKSQASLPTGTYTMQTDSELPAPAVSLQDDNRFSFCYSVISSYLPMGTYEEKDGQLILSTDDRRYTFDIKDGKLVFNASASTPVPFGEVTDGAVFVREDKKS